jgi:hypothetical protein
VNRWFGFIADLLVAQTVIPFVERGHSALPEAVDPLAELARIRAAWELARHVKAAEYTEQIGSCLSYSHLVADVYTAFLERVGPRGTRAQ